MRPHKQNGDTQGRSIVGYRQTTDSLCNCHVLLPVLANKRIQQESVRPRWPYDMRPSVRAEKYIRDASACRKVVTDGNDNGTDGQTDGQTDRRIDRVRRNMRPLLGRRAA